MYAACGDRSSFADGFVEKNEMRRSNFTSQCLPNADEKTQISSPSGYTICPPIG